MIETDYKPLVPILNKKDLDTLPPRVLCFRLRMARFDYFAEHLPGKLLYTTDALSRAPLLTTDDAVREEATKTESFVALVTTAFPAHANTWEKLKRAQQSDPTCAQVITYCRSGWPLRNQLRGNILQYWQAKDSLTLADDFMVVALSYLLLSM